MQMFKHDFTCGSVKEQIRTARSNSSKYKSSFQPSTKARGLILQNLYTRWDVIIVSSNDHW